MTLDQQVLAERKRLLDERLLVLDRLAGHLRFSFGRLPYPLPGLDTRDPVELESVSARGERSDKLQDLLTGVFR